ncbi:ABC transporter ATP-binding protein [Tautonia plasticadhaerens]|uniref:Multidrug export ATP-binding/permease protein n=1 Tax=Tautonia plasticadhaerens TaxID=2527974 RepID=A0A518H6M5_9BACT|nr:ABC transporter ATP-binding protein [Tautonia plasticadhaerens]QDV36492.1 Putative multidrug export ATP-binding/permease protein [Tautonia plasticadhaerens]
MSWDDYRRVRRGARIDSTRQAVIHLAGVVQSLLVVALVLVVGLVIALIDSGPGEATVRLEGSGDRTLARISLALPGDPSGAASLESRRVAAQGILAILVAVALGLLLAITTLDALRRWAAARLSARLGAALRRQIHRQMYRFGQSSLPTEGIGPIVDLFTRQVDDLRDGFRAGLDGLWRLPVLFIGLLVLALALSWQMALFLGVLGLLVALLASSLLRRSSSSATAAERDSAMKMSLLHEDLGQIRTVRVFAIEGADNRRFDDHLEEYREADASRLPFDTRPGPGVALLLGIAGALAFGMVGYLALAGALEPSTALTLALTLGLLPLPLSGWARMRRVRRRAARAAFDVARFLDRRPELLQVPAAKFLSPVRNRIVLENVSVEGPTGRRLLEGVSLELPAGSRTALMGRDEDSKQALVCLLPRLLDPRTGRVRMDGLDLREVTLDSLRAQVSTVFQSDLIFSDTVRFNIGLGDPSYDLPRMIEAAKNAHAHHIIQDLPEGYDTYVGPLGHYLRVDEQYRIALARAWLHDPSILIIEEPTVPLDETIKPLIDDAVARLSQGRTVLFLAHRLSTIRACDRVIVLHNGRIEASGTARDLQAESKLYRHLQYLEFNQFAAGGIEAGQMHG